jgi:hypothetical protein
MSEQNVHFTGPRVAVVGDDRDAAERARLGRAAR